MQKILTGARIIFTHIVLCLDLQICSMSKEPGAASSQGERHLPRHAQRRQEREHHPAATSRCQPQAARVPDAGPPHGRQSDRRLPPRGRRTTHNGGRA